MERGIIMNKSVRSDSADQYCEKGLMIKRSMEYRNSFTNTRICIIVQYASVMLACPFVTQSENMCMRRVLFSSAVHYTCHPFIFVGMVFLRSPGRSSSG